MAGLDLGDVLGIISGSERIHAATIRRFTERFSRFNLPDTALRPSYGLAEATLYVTSAPSGQPPETVRFDYEKLSAGHAKRCGSEGGSSWSATAHHGRRRCASSIPRPGSRIPAGKIGEIWVHGDNVASGYWRNPQQIAADVRCHAGRSITGYAAGALAAHRRSGSHVRGRAVHHRPHQGSADRGWAQPLSR